MYITVIRPVLEYCAPVWHYAITKAQTESLKDVQKRAIHVVHNLTRGMAYSPMLFYSNFNSLASCREDLSHSFFRNVLNTDSCLCSLLPPPRPPVVSRHLKAHIFPNLSRSPYSHTPLLFFHTIWS